MQILINTLHVLKRNLLPQHHLVERPDEERIQETTMEDGQTNNPANKLEVIQVLWVNAGVRIDLQSIVIVCGILEQTIEGIEHFVGKKEEEFTAFVSNQINKTLL